MDREALRKDLERLHHDLLHADPDDPEERATVARLRREIKTLLDQEESTGQQYQTLGEQMKQEVYRFETSHPRLASTMAQVIDTLALFNL